MRDIALVTSSRADYSHLRSILGSIDRHQDLRYRLIVFGAHLSPAFGMTVTEIEADGWTIDARLESLMGSDTDVGMAKSIGLATLGLADVLDRWRPDGLVVIADRYEMLAAANVALALRIPIAHIEGGELSLGAIDDAVRHALTKMAHWHFVPHQRAAARVRSLGEEAWRIQIIGASSLDHLPVATSRPSQEPIPATGPLVVVAVHPVTLSPRPADDGLAVLQAVSERQADVVCCFPNCDAGAQALIAASQVQAVRNPRFVVKTNLAPAEYFDLLQRAHLMIGNSSSGIMESASFGLPAVDVGDRQRDRLRAANIIHAPGDAAAIASAIDKALSDSFRRIANDVVNPYHCPGGSDLLAETLANSPPTARLLDKRPWPVTEADNG